MGQEIERKFLVIGDSWRTETPVTLRQGYLANEISRSVRIRTDRSNGYLTVKGKAVGAVRPEFEYAIPLSEANEMLDRLCLSPLITKRRHYVAIGGKRWEIDEFLEENRGLVVAEIELQEEDETFDRPPWLGQEVTNDPRYLNANLVNHPFSAWNSHDSL